jgi:DNA invertase Pin-like site-specific DNA recombinase
MSKKNRKGNAKRDESGQPLAGAKRRRRRSRADRGMPGSEALRELARTYLELQHRLWPERAESDSLPERTDENVEFLVDEFKRRFLVENGNDQLEAELHTGDVSGCYVRYSDAGSNPRSLAQQLRLQLERARQNGHFIPWNHVYGDAAITGTTADRRGYRMAKAAIADKEGGIEVLYIDGIGRASRDMVEALLLGQLIEQSGRRMIGVSDGFDSDVPLAKMQLAIFAALQEMFIDQLRSGVIRGMDDAFRQGTNTGLPAIGYGLAPAVDPEGRQLFGKDGDQLNMLVVDRKMARRVKLAFRLFGEKGWSMNRIARRFNERRVGGKETWDSTRIRQLLTRRKYVGIEVYRTKRQFKHAVTGDIVTQQRPRSEWLVRRNRSLKIVSWGLWKKVQQRLAECREAYGKKRDSGPRRTDLYPTTLVRPVCGCCGEPMWLGRSGKYASYTCLNGRDGKHRCSFRGYKSVKIVEESIIGHIKQSVFTPERIEQLVELANQYLAEEAAKPRTHTKPIKAELRRERSRCDRLVKVLSRSGEDGLDAVVARIRQHEVRIKELSVQIRAAESSNEVPTPIDKTAVEAILSDLRKLWQQDVAAIAPLLRELTGAVTVHVEREEGKRRATWFAEFTVNLVPVIAKLTATRNCPTTRTWEYLETRSWTIQETEGVWLGTVPTYERIATAAIEMVDRGVSVVTIATALNTSRETVREALVFTRTGKRPCMKPTGKKTRKRNGPPKYIAIREEVLSRHVGKVSFHRIAVDLGVSECTVRRSWDSAHREEVQAAVAEGRTPNRGGYRHLAADKIKRMREMILMANGTSREIAMAVGVSTNTVQRERKRMLTDAASS